MGLDDADEFTQVDGFADVGGGARGQAPLAVAGHGQGGQGDDGHAGQIGLGPQGANGRQAVHVRHANVHDDDAGPLGTGKFDGGAAVAGDDEAVAVAGEIGGEDIQAVFVVVGQQNERPQGRRGFDRVRGARGRASIGNERGGRFTRDRQIGRGYRGWIGYRLPRQTDGEAAALAGRAVQAHFAAVQARKPRNEGQTQAGALILAGQAAVDLDEGLKEPGLILQRDADAGVADGEAQPLCAGIGVDREADASACGSEFDGVAEQVDQDLLETARVGVDDGRRHAQVRGDGDGFAGGGGFDELQAGGADGVDGQRLHLQAQLARFDLGEVQDVVDERQQVPPAVFDDAQRARLFGGERALIEFAQGFGEAQDGGERRAQFVAHVGQEFVFEAVGAGQFGVGGGQPIVGDAEVVGAIGDAAGEVGALVGQFTLAALDGVGHPIVVLGQTAQFVALRPVHALVQIAGGGGLGDAGELANGGGDDAGDDEGDEGGGQRGQHANGIGDAGGGFGDAQGVGVVTVQNDAPAQLLNGRLRAARSGDDRLADQLIQTVEDQALVGQSQRGAEDRARVRRQGA